MNSKRDNGEAGKPQTYTNFEDLAKKLVEVPREEVEKRQRLYEQERAKRKNDS